MEDEESCKFIFKENYPTAGNRVNLPWALFQKLKLHIEADRACPEAREPSGTELTQR